MGRDEVLAEAFESERGRLTRLARDILGAEDLAEDAVQDAWLRLARRDGPDPDNLAAWLTTVVSRVCIDELRSRDAAARAAMRVTRATETSVAGGDGPEQDDVAAALHVVLERLSPSERVAFVLHDVYDVPFDEVARVLGRSSAASKMLASRARSKVRDATREPSSGPIPTIVVEQFLAASRRGDLAALLSILSPDAELVADAEARALGAPAHLSGRDAVADLFCGRARAARVVTLDGSPALAWFVGGQPRVAWDFVLDEAGRIRVIDMLGSDVALAGVRSTRAVDEGGRRP